MAETDIALIAHLMRRTGFGATRDELEAYASKGYEDVVEVLLHPERSPDIEEDLLSRYNGWDHNTPGGAALWLYRMVNTKRPLEEKIALFWHHVFATGTAKSEHDPSHHQQLAMLRRVGLSDMRTILVELSKDPAMIYWLDNSENHRGEPNENYGRELLQDRRVGEWRRGIQPARGGLRGQGRRHLCGGLRERPCSALQRGGQLRREVPGGRKPIQVSGGVLDEQRQAAATSGDDLSGAAEASAQPQRGEGGRPGQDVRAGLRLLPGAGLSEGRDPAGDRPDRRAPQVANTLHNLMPAASRGPQARSPLEDRSWTCLQLRPTAQQVTLWPTFPISKCGAAKKNPCTLRRPEDGISGTIP